MKKNLINFLYCICAFGLIGCQTYILPPPTPVPIPTRSLSIEELTEILQDPRSTQFVTATEQLAEFGGKAHSVTPILAQALRYPQRHVFVACQALIKIGPTLETIPQLTINLKHERLHTKLYSVLALGKIGEAAYCTVPSMAPFLWHEDDGLRASAAIAINNIADLNLLDPWQSEISDQAYLADSPKGAVTNPIREWWITRGQWMEWVACSF